MLVVLDSNIFISALISKTGSPHKCYEAWLSGRFDLVSSINQIEEIKRISRYPKLQKSVPKHVFGDLIKALYGTTLIKAAETSIELNDPDDAFLLGMAKAGDADYLVTGDKRAGLLALGNYGRTRIVTPVGFVAEVLH